MFLVGLWSGNHRLITGGAGPSGLVFYGALRRCVNLYFRSIKDDPASARNPILIHLLCSKSRGLARDPPLIGPVFGLVS